MILVGKIIKEKLDQELNIKERLLYQITMLIRELKVLK